VRSGQQDLLGHRVYKVCKAWSAPQDRKAYKVYRVMLGQPDLLETQAQLAHKDQQALQERKVFRVMSDLRDRRAYRAFKVFRAMLGQQDHKEFKVYRAM
jgi:hypothetical protein